MGAGPRPGAETARLTTAARRRGRPLQGRHHADIREVDIIDVAGRRVRRLFDGMREAGAQVTGWDLYDDAGHPVRNGVYFGRVRAGGESVVSRIAVMR